jgi:hypothetical protein
MPAEARMPPRLGNSIRHLPTVNGALRARQGTVRCPCRTRTGSARVRTGASLMRTTPHRAPNGGRGDKRPTAGGVAACPRRHAHPALLCGEAGPELRRLRQRTDDSHLDSVRMRLVIRADDAEREHHHRGFPDRNRTSPNPRNGPSGRALRALKSSVNADFSESG